MPKLYQSKEDEYYISIKVRGVSFRAVIVNSEGEEFTDGNLFTISSEGELVIHDGVNPSAAEKAGILLDDECKIKTHLPA